MPLLFLLVLVLLTPLLAIALMPFGLVQRYRAGTARRAARLWLASLNTAALLFSTCLFFGGAAFTSLWVPNAFVSSLAGFCAGVILARLGLNLTQWEESAGKLHYTPNRFLVLAITLLVMTRLLYGLWRLFQSWQVDDEGRAWLLESGVPGSLAAGALVLGYSLAFWLGVNRRVRESRRNT